MPAELTNTHTYADTSMSTLTYPTTETLFTGRHKALTETYVCIRDDFIATETSTTKDNVKTTHFQRDTVHKYTKTWTTHFIHNETLAHIMLLRCEHIELQMHFYTREIFTIEKK